MTDDTHIGIEMRAQSGYHIFGWVENERFRKPECVTFQVEKSRTKQEAIINVAARTGVKHAKERRQIRASLMASGYARANTTEGKHDVGLPTSDLLTFIHRTLFLILKKADTWIIMIGHDNIILQQYIFRDWANWKTAMRQNITRAPTSSHQSSPSADCIQLRPRRLEYAGYRLGSAPAAYERDGYSTFRRLSPREFGMREYLCLIFNYR